MFTPSTPDPNKGLLCTVDAKATQLSLWFYNKVGWKNPPCVVVSYGIEELRRISLITSAMHKAHTPPKVHIWDDDKPNPEIVVVFHLRNPALPVVLNIVNRHDDETKSFFKQHPVRDVIATGETELPQRGIRTLLSEFGRCGRVVVCLTDATDAANTKATFLPLTMFDVKSIERQSPFKDFA